MEQVAIATGQNRAGAVFPGNTGIGRHMLLLAVNRNNQGGLQAAVEVSQLFLAGVTRCMQGTLTVIGVDDGYTPGGQVFNEASHRTLIARYGLGAEDDGIAWADGQLGMTVHGQLVQCRPDLTLASGCQRHNFLLGQVIQVFRGNGCEIGVEVVTGLGTAVHVIQRPAQQPDPPAHRMGNTQHRLQAGHVAGKAGHHDFTGQGCNGLQQTIRDIPLAG